METQLNPCLQPASAFSAHAGMKTLVAEASTLGFRPGQVPCGALYTDACDVGITLLNHNTMKMAHFFHQGEVLNGDEVHAWVYHPTTETLRKHPKLKGWTVHILND